MPDPSIPIGDQVEVIATPIVTSARDLSGFEARRALPFKQCQMVGRFLFLIRWVRQSI